jgi:TonB family protein
MQRARLHRSVGSSAEYAQSAGGNAFEHFLQGNVPQKTNPWALGAAILANGTVLAILLLMGLGKTAGHFADPVTNHPIHLSDFTLFASSRGQGGGSGGSNDSTPAIEGRPPRQEVMPLLPPQPPLLEHSQLQVDPAIAVSPEIKLPDSQSMPNIGVHRSPNVSLISNGPGGPAGLGNHRGTGDGPGDGPGYDAGKDGGFGDSVYRPGIGGVSNPVPLLTPEAEFSDEARRNKHQGICVVFVIVDAHGNPQNPRVVQSLGMGLDEKALEAVKRYRFKPAM